ncbi:hypothetical protein HYX04_01295 [Candidatus Woesearchaeota archaeon]|nr:hypothetical protein [Candidatus Woesearchaeota archaeon]
MKLKLEVDFQYYGHWTFALLAATLVLSLGYFNLLSQKSHYSLKMGLMAVAFFILYLISEKKYTQTYNELRKKLKGEDKMPKSKFLKFIFNKNYFMNYTYSYFGGIMAALAIAYVLGENPFGYPWYSILVFTLITFSAGLGCVSLIAFGFAKK